MRENIFSVSAIDIACPALYPPKHGFLECRRPSANPGNLKNVFLLNIVYFYQTYHFFRSSAQH